VSRDIEETPVGYPGFIVSGPARLSPTIGTLKRVALAKLSDVRFFSATFDGEELLFEPWLTTLIDYGASARFVGVYRTEPETDDEEEADAPAEDSKLGTLCLRQSEWVRDTDLAQSGGAEDLREYLTAGPQVDNTLVFGAGTAHPEIVDATRQLLSKLATGITIAASEPRSTAWHYVAVEVADNQFTTTISYSPLLAKCDVLETNLPSWLACVDDLVKRPGWIPGSEVTLSIRRSVPELLDAPYRGVTQVTR